MFFLSTSKKYIANSKETRCRLKIYQLNLKSNLFAKNIWTKESIFNKDSVWLRDIEKNYCQNVTVKEYEINEVVVEKAINKLQLSKAPGRDCIVGYWFKKLTFYRSGLLNLFRKTLQEETELPCWLSLAKTILIPKCEETNLATN